MEEEAATSSGILHWNRREGSGNFEKWCQVEYSATCTCTSLFKTYVGYNSAKNQSSAVKSSSFSQTSTELYVCFSGWLVRGHLSEAYRRQLKNHIKKYNSIRKCNVSSLFHQTCRWNDTRGGRTTNVSDTWQHLRHEDWQQTKFAPKICHSRWSNWYSS